MARCGATVGRWFRRHQCKKRATVAFDVWNPWKDHDREEVRHYEICDEHARDLWGYDGRWGGGRYLDREKSERIKRGVAASGQLKSGGPE